MSPYKTCLSTIFAWLAAGGCSHPTVAFDSDPAPATPEMFSVSSAMVSVDSSGEGLFQVVVPEGATAFQISAVAEDQVEIGIEALIDPSGEIFLDVASDPTAGTSLSSIGGWFSPDGVVNYPLRASDPPFDAGVWTVRLSSWDPVEIKLTIASKADLDFGEGTLNVHIVFAKTIDEVQIQATKEAVEHWQNAWAPHGLHVEPYYATSNIHKACGVNLPGDRVWREASEHGTEFDITLMICNKMLDRVAGQSVTPGTLTSGWHGTASVKGSAFASRDGAFTEGGVERFGMTMAHEASHYLGLPHVHDNMTRWDGLDDTPNCADQQSCFDQLFTNNMYPSPWCGTGESINDCELQDQLTEDQVFLLQHAVGIL